MLAHAGTLPKNCSIQSRMIATVLNGTIQASSTSVAAIIVRPYNPEEQTLTVRTYRSHSPGLVPVLTTGRTTQTMEVSSTITPTISSKPSAARTRSSRVRLTGSESVNSVEPCSPFVELNPNGC